MKSLLDEVKDRVVFVFGSNLAGAHGAGAAKVALDHHGAELGRGIGHHGNSYAIPTKDFQIQTLALPTVERYISDFIKYARNQPHLSFKVTQIGCGLAGFEAIEIAPLFRNSPQNCYFDTAWKEFLGDSVRYWGTFDVKPKRRA